MTKTVAYATPENKSIIIKAIENQKARSCWAKGVKEYAIDLVNRMYEGSPINERTLLRGADDWSDYSYNGYSLIIGFNIAKTLCTPSELKRTRYGELPPNKKETWLDVQSKALREAAQLIISTVSSLNL